MPVIKHHLSDALLLAYSAGTLPEAFGLVVATHVSLCDSCRTRLEAFDAVGGAVLESVGVASVAEDSLAATMARIAGGPEGTKAPIVMPGPARSSVYPAVFPSPLRAYAGGDAAAVRWRSVGGGVRQMVLDTSREASARLLYIPAGAAVPDHGHRGTELTLVLQGAFSDEDGRFARGDVEIANESVEHQPVAEPGEDCICLAATDAPLRFNGLIPRIAQRFIGI